MFEERARFAPGMPSYGYRFTTCSAYAMTVELPGHGISDLLAFVCHRVPSRVVPYLSWREAQVLQNDLFDCFDSQVRSGRRKERMIFYNLLGNLLCNLKKIVQIFKHLITQKSKSHKKSECGEKSFMVGKYVEELSTGGELIVTISGWQIRYYFPGPDLRYNGTSKTIQGIEIDQYKQAFINNFKEYLSLKSLKQGEYVSRGALGMTINVNCYNEGVCLISYHMPIDSTRKLADLINDYEYASKRAEQVMTMLRQLA